MSKAMTCLCGCGRIATRRGLYISCYTRTQKQVDRGETSWEDEIKKGKALPALSRRQRRQEFNRPLDLEE
jgi:hypothetical protein